MKKLAAKKVETANFQNSTKSVKKNIDQTLKSIHKRMTTMFHVNFAYFSDIKVIQHSEILNQLTQRMRNDLKENGMVHSSVQWRQVCEILSRNQAAGFFENFAFYNPRDDVLYMNEKMIINHPEKTISVCAHELSEKLLSAYVSPPVRSSIQPAVRLYFEAKKTGNTKRLSELLNLYIDTVFKTVFKEGCCEAIALQTLRSMDYETEAASLEKELQTGYPKCIDLLFYIENARKSGECVEKDQIRHQALDEGKLAKEVLKSSQIIKGVSYYLGYPLAKAVLEKYGIEGVRSAIENHPPLKAQYFANPQTYLILLEKMVMSN
jgi:hypothetical protein